MKLKIDKLLLDNAIERVSKSVDANPFLPVMKGILIQAEDNKITLIGSNGETSIKHEIETSIDAQIELPGIVLVELSLFKNIIKKLDGEIVLEVVNNILKISTNNENYNLNIYDVNEYIAIDFACYGEQVKINWNDFKSLVRDVIFAASTNEVSLILCCVNISAANKKIKFITTDRFRYAQAVQDISEDVTFNISILAKNLRDITNFDYNGDVILNISDQKISFKLDSTTIESKVVDQLYQDVSRIVPQEFDTELKITKKELNNLLNKASVIINENYNKIKLHIVDNVLTISSVREEIANAEIKTNNFSYNGEELKLALNSRFLKDAISVYEDNLNILFTKDKLRIVIKSDSNPNVLQLITPQKGF